MRKVLTAVVVVLLFTGLFAGSWFLTGTLSGDDADVAPTTPDAAVTTVAGAVEQDGAIEPAAPTSVEFVKSTSIQQFWFQSGSVLAKLNSNAVVRARAIMYSTLAIYETFEPAGEPGILPGVDGGYGIDQAVLAGGHVLSEVVGNPVLTEAIESWDGEMTAETRAIAETIVARAKADGFDAAGETQAPVFEGPLGWVPGGKRDGMPAGFEPGFGSVTPLLFDIDACPVAPAPLSQIMQEKESLGEISTDAKTPLQASPELVGGTGLSYINVTPLPDAEIDQFYVGMNLYVLIYDAMIATWKAQWANGVASPLDVAAGDLVEFKLSQPSYPSWNAVALSALETYINEIYGSDVTAAEIEQKGKSSSLQSNADTTASGIGLLSETLTGKTYNWDADISAGRELGACLAKQAVARVRR